MWTSVPPLSSSPVCCHDVCGDVCVAVGAACVAVGAVCVAVGVACVAVGAACVAVCSCRLS